MNYKTNVLWDSTIIGVWFLPADPNSREVGVEQLAYAGYKITAGAPANIADHWTPGATVECIDGKSYRNNATTASPNFIVVDTGAAGSLTDNHIFVGGVDNLPHDVALSKDATILATGALTVVGIRGNPVLATAPNPGDVYTWNGVAFAPGAVVNSALAHNDIFVGSVANTAVAVPLSKDLTIIETGAATVVGLQGNTVLASTPPTGGTLMFDGTFWGGNLTPVLLFTLIGANMNSTADQTLVGPIPAGTAFVITDIVFKNASVALTTADTGGFWSGAAQSGSHYAELDTASLAKLTTNTKFISLPQEIGSATVGAMAGNEVAGTSVIFSLGTAQGAPATADILVFGYCLV